LKCNTTFILYNNACVTTCLDGYYLDSATV